MIKRLSIKILKKCQKDLIQTSLLSFIIIFLVLVCFITLNGIPSKYIIPIDKLVMIVQNTPDNQVSELVNKYTNFEYYIFSFIYKLFCWNLVFCIYLFLAKIKTIKDIENLPVLQNKIVIYSFIPTSMYILYKYYYYVNLVDLRTDYYTLTFNITGGLEYWSVIIYFIFFFVSYLCTIFIYYYIYSVNIKNKVLKILVYVCLSVTILQSLISFKEPFVFQYIIIPFIEIYWLYIHNSGLKYLRMDN